VEDDRGLQPVTVRHRLEVLIPPAITNTEPAAGDGQQLVVKQGSKVRLQCSATGNPVPRQVMEYNLISGEEKFFLCFECF
jgi:hypothetical protein